VLCGPEEQTDWGEGLVEVSTERERGIEDEKVLSDSMLGEERQISQSCSFHRDVQVCASGPSMDREGARRLVEVRRKERLACVSEKRSERGRRHEQSDSTLEEPEPVSQ
jgi:hypothetical protein